MPIFHRFLQTFRFRRRSEEFADSDGASVISRPQPPRTSIPQQQQEQEQQEQQQASSLDSTEHAPISPVSVLDVDVSTVTTSSSPNNFNLELNTSSTGTYIRPVHQQSTAIKNQRTIGNGSPLPVFEVADKSFKSTTCTSTPKRESSPPIQYIFSQQITPDEITTCQQQFLDSQDDSTTPLHLHITQDYSTVSNHSAAHPNFVMEDFNNISISRIDSNLYQEIESTNEQHRRPSHEMQQRVFIERGIHKNKTGIVVEKKDRRTWKVKLDHGSEVNVLMTSVKVIPNNPKSDGTNSMPTCTEQDAMAVDHSSPMLRRVFIEKGTNKNKHGTVLGMKDRRTIIVQLDEGYPVHVLVTSVRDVQNTGTDYDPEPLSDAPTFKSTIQSSVLKNPMVVSNPPKEQPMRHQSTNIESCSPQPSNSSNVARRVMITKGAHKGSMAEILRLKDQRTYAVQLIPTGQEVGVRISSVEFCDSEIHRSFPTTTQKNLVESSHDDRNGSVCLPSTISTAQDIGQVSMAIPNLGRTTPSGTTRNMGDQNGFSTHQRQIRRESTRLKTATTQPTQTTRSDCSIRSGHSERSSTFFRNMRIRHGSGNAFGGYKIKKIRLDDDDDDDDPKKNGATNFLQYSLGDRLICLERPMKGKKQKRFDKTILQNGRTYELISVRIQDDKDAGSIYGRPQVAELFYVDTADCVDGSTFSVQQFLCKFGDFSVLDPRKIAARLELFHSPARFAIRQLDANEFCDIEEEGNVGCGFIQEDLLHRICRDGGLSAPAAALVSAIQVRLFIPTMGIYKGILQRKRIVEGPRIQLPPSMKKVPASTFPEEMNKAYMVICQAGIHPSSGSANEFIGRQLDHRRKPPPLKSFTAKIQKPLSSMVLDLWKSLGVPDQELNRYKKESLKPSRRNHAWVVGVADPTGALPVDCIYVPGITQEQPKQFFVTRSPCLRHDDGRLLQSVHCRPESMSEEQWNELQSLPFGSIIFSRPRQGVQTMPERIAKGDLDGDLYLICWDIVILSHMTQVDPMTDIPMDDDGTLKLFPHNPNWLDDAHEIMTAAGFLNEMGDLVGELYKLSEKTAKGSALGKRDPDAMAFADAFNEALEYKKHGRPIQLPKHLVEKIRETRRHLVTHV